MFRKGLWIMILLLMLSSEHPPLADAEGKKLRVGIYNFQPLVFIDAHGNPEGFFIDILAHIAGKEGWKITYVPGSWNECLNRFQAGDTDLLASIAYSPERARYSDFTREHLFVLWAEIYAHRDAAIETLPDLEGKTVGVLRGALANADFRTLLDQFGVTCRIREYAEYASVFRAVRNREADAGIFTNIYGIQNQLVQHLHRTQIIFAPTKIRFAVRKHQCPEVLATFDRYFAALKADRDSVYYRSYDRWMGNLSDSENFRRIVQITGIFLLLAVFVLLLMIVINQRLRAAVDARTSELEQINQALREQEKALRESEEKFHKAFHSSPVIMSISNMDDGTFLDVNAAFLKLTGRDRHEVIGTEADELGLWPRKDRDAMIAEIRKRGYVHGREVEIITKPGGRLHILWYADVVTIGGSPCLIVSGHDLTQRKRAEEARARSEAFLKTLYHHSEVAVFVVDVSEDRDYVYAGINPCHEKLIGVPAQWVPGKRPKDLTPYLEQEVIDVIYALYDQCAETRQLVQIEHSAMLEGRETWWITTVKPLLDENNAVYRLIGTAIAITDRKHAENKLKEYSERLEEMVAERTRELRNAQEELLLKERLAVLGHFAGSISHEIRNPLAAIDSSVYFLEMKLGQSDEKILQHLGRISGNVGKATAIIQSLLSLTRMEKPDAELLDLNEFVRETIRSSRIPDTVEVITEISEEDQLSICADGEQIRMALKNIIRNALQAMDEEGTLTISVQPGETGMVRLSLADTGAGISAEHLGKIFQPLFTTKAQGIGFGLSITKMIIENHGGTVSAESEPGNGATLTLTLPLAEKIRLPEK